VEGLPQCFQLRRPRKWSTGRKTIRSDVGRQSEVMSEAWKRCKANQSVPLHLPPLLWLLRLEVDWRNGPEWNFRKGSGSDLPWRGRVSLVEVCYSLWCVDFGCILPTVVFWPVTFPLNFKLEPPAEHLACPRFSRLGIRPRRLSLPGEVAVADVFRVSGRVVRL
jgi:hypothetical protein